MRPMAAYVIDLAKVRANLEILGEIRQRTGCRIVQALKAFALPPVFPLLREHLDGCCASGLWEARLAHEYFGGDLLTCGPAYADEDSAVFDLSSHLDFNSLPHWQHWRPHLRSHPRFLKGDLHCGLRINPRCSTGATALYDPCSPGSRLGTPPGPLNDSDLDGLSGLHFHTLCEQGSEDLETTLEAVHDHFGPVLEREQFRWLNLGGGHWITQPDYNRELLCQLIDRTRERYQLDTIWLEPGEAAFLHAGVLECEVLDLFQNGEVTVAILDISATAHMPDVLEMPYRPKVHLESTPATESGTQRYRLGGNTCLAGDVIGDYTFHRPLQVGDQLEFQDMAQYTMVKSTFFNGVAHPDLVLRHEDGRRETIRTFTYEDFKSRLGAP